jgi:hypothetical protein
MQIQRRGNLAWTAHILIAGLVTFGGCTTLPEWRETFVSPIVDNQGYATDGSDHFTFGTTSIRLRDYSTWLVKAENTKPLGGLVGYNHLGDGDYFKGKLYVPMGQYGLGSKACVGDPKSTIGLFDARTLEREAIYIVPDVRDPSGIAVAPDQGENGTIYMTPFCDSSHIYSYDLSSFELLKIIRLSSPLENMQGIAYRDGLLYIVSDSPTDRITVVTPDGVVQDVVYAVKSFEAEGIDYSQAEIRWVYKDDATTTRVHFLVRR